MTQRCGFALILFALAPPLPLWCQIAAPVEIHLATGSDLEQQGREQLERILAKWDLSPLLFTRKVQIQSDVIPHSHPVLTVTTQYLANDTAQLATFAHEQLHWFFTRRQAATDSAIADLEPLYPEAPSGPPQGARDRYSTYLHLLVCLAEFDAVKALLDEPTARRTLSAWRHYRWVYQEILNRPEPIRAILTRYHLDRTDARR